jgi:adenylate cyclase
VNTASRLCNLAKAGEVLASEAAVQRAGSGFQAESLPVAQVRGKEKGVVIYKVTGLAAADKAS